MKNKLTDLNDNLFLELERLNDEDISKDELIKEINRSTAICHVAKNIIENAKVEFSVIKLQAEYGKNLGAMPTMLSYEKKNETSK